MRRKGNNNNKSSSSSTESSSNNNHHSLSTVSSATSSSQHSRLISTDLQLGLGSTHHASPSREGLVQNDKEHGKRANNNNKLFVKVYMEGISIGRKLDLVALGGYHHLINTLQFMFHTTIIWAEGEELHPENSHVLTYEDKEGDWMIVGDVPWEAFLSTVKRLKITRIE